MAADATYPLGGQGIYLKQGSTEMVIGSTSLLTIAAGATITDAGTHTLSAGGSLTVASSAYIADPVTTGSSGVTLPNYGHATLTGGTTATGAKTYPVAAPVAGCRLTAHATTANTSDAVLIDLNGATLSGWGTQDIIKLSTSGDFVELVGLSSSQWAIVGRTPTTVTTTS